MGTWGTFHFISLEGCRPLVCLAPSLLPVCKSVAAFAGEEDSPKDREPVAAEGENACPGTEGSGLWSPGNTMSAGGPELLTTCFVAHKSNCMPSKPPARGRPEEGCLEVALPRVQTVEPDCLHMILG